MRCVLWSPICCGSVGRARGDEQGSDRALEESIDYFELTPSGRAEPAAELTRVRYAEGRIAEAISYNEAAMRFVTATGPSEEGDAVIRLTHVELSWRRGGPKRLAP